MDQAGWLLAVILVLGLVSHNSLIAWSACALLMVKAVGAESFLPWLGRYGLDAGLFLLVLTILVPVAEGRITAERFLSALGSPSGLVAVGISAASAYVARFGVDLLHARPEILVGLVVGSVVGVVAGGIPTGPLIAAGVTALLVRWLGP